MVAAKSTLVGTRQEHASESRTSFRDRCGKCGANRIDRQIGLESTPDAYIARMVEVFREVRRVLRDDGTLWLNMGDSYNAGTSSKRKKPKTNVDVGGWNDAEIDGGARINDPTVKTKDLCMMPWRVALALQADGWYIRSVIVWAKKSPMPESVTDRPTSSWEPIFLMAKSERYFYDAEAVKEASIHAGAVVTNENGKNGEMGKYGATRTGFMKKGGVEVAATRNQRNVWHLGPEPYAEAHFATFPTEIPRRCILAGSRPGDTVMDPFNGSGTTGAVAVQHGRNYVGIELNPAYIELAKDRIGKARNPATYQSQKVVDAPLFGVAP